MKKSLLLTSFAALFLLAAQSLSAQTSQRYYWVGAGTTNDWGLIENWSNTSGGAGSQGLTTSPSNVNTCIFDQNSFLNGDSTVLISGAVQCDSLMFFNPTHKAKISFSGSNSNLTVNGSLELQSGM